MSKATLSDFYPARPPLARLVNEVASAIKRPRTTRRIARDVSMPMGDGHAVMVLPPALHGDRITHYPRKVLGQLNYQVSGWGFGPNVGPSERLVDGALERLNSLADRHGPVSLVGYSLGGLFARWLAHEAPHLIRQVVTVCSPFRAPLSSCSLALAPLCWRWNGPRERALAASMCKPIPVPGTYLYSRSDGIVGWASCIEQSAAPGENIEFKGSHVSITSNPTVTRIIATRLATVPRSP